MATTLMIGDDTAKRLKLLSEKSNIPMAKIVKELSFIADFIPENADSISLVFVKSEQKRSVSAILLPIYCGSFEVKNDMSEKEVDAKIREDLKKKVS